MDWEQIAAHAVIAMSQCCGCNIEGCTPQDYLRAHLTNDEIRALESAVRETEAASAVAR
jgi:hypothetical protein